MSQVEELHEQAMDIAEEAFTAKRKGRSEEALRLFRDALMLEREAASTFLNAKDSEPTRSILFRSAAALAFHAGDYNEAEHLVANGLAGFPPAEIKIELRALQDDIDFRRHISLQGTKLSEDEMQMTLWGNATGHGIISADLLIKRIEQIKAIFYRTVERMSELPYRSMGKPPKLVTDYYQLFLTALVPSSFGVTFTIGQPSEQLELFPDYNAKKIQPAQVIDEVIECFELIQQDEFEALQKRFGDDNYYQNFIAVAKQMAPDGEDIKVLGLTALRDGAEKTIGLRKTKQEITPSQYIATEKDKNQSRENFRLEGELKVANSLATKEQTGRVKLVTSDGKAVSIRVPITQMQDVVQPYFDEYVVITGYKQGRSLFLVDIDKGTGKTTNTEEHNSNLSTPMLFDE